LQCCRVAALAKPDDWEPWIEDKQFGFRELKARGYEELFRDALERRLKKLAGESVMVKADMIFRLCKLPAEFKSKEGYAYDKDRLSTLDEQRHKIVHGDGLGSRFPNVEEDLEYLHDTSMHFIRMVFQKYHLEVHPKVIREFLKFPDREAASPADE
jgi:hypothetical protein